MSKRNPEEYAPRSMAEYTEDDYLFKKHLKEGFSTDDFFMIDSFSHTLSEDKNNYIEEAIQYFFMMMLKLNYQLEQIVSSLDCINRNFGESLEGINRQL